MKSYFSFIKHMCYILPKIFGMIDFSYINIIVTNVSNVSNVTSVTNVPDVPNVSLWVSCDVN